MGVVRTPAHIKRQPPKSGVSRVLHTKKRATVRRKGEPATRVLSARATVRAALKAQADADLAKAKAEEAASAAQSSTEVES